MSAVAGYSPGLIKAFQADLTQDERESISMIMESGTACAINYIRDTFLKEMAAPKGAKDITIKINMRDKTGKAFQGCIRRESLLKQEREFNKDVLEKIGKTDEIKQELTKTLSKHLARKVAQFLLKEVQPGETAGNGASIVFALDKCEEIQKNRIHPVDSVLVQHACNVMAGRLTYAPDSCILLLKSVKYPNSWT